MYRVTLFLVEQTKTPTKEIILSGHKIHQNCLLPRSYFPITHPVFLSVDYSPVPKPLILIRGLQSRTRHLKNVLKIRKTEHFNGRLRFKDKRFFLR